jgi:hypothetical protein
MSFKSEKKSKKKIVNINSSPSLSQGNKFDKYQNKIKKNLEKTDKLLFTEGFNNMKNLDLQANGLTNQTVNAVKQNSINSQQQQSLNELRQEYQNTLSQYENLLSQINGTTSSYFNRVNPNNPYLGKNVTFTTGESAYVTQQGVVKLYPLGSQWIPNQVFLGTAGKNGCPSGEMTPIQLPWLPSYNTPGTSIPSNPPLVTGTPMQEGQSCGNEGSNIYVDELLPSNLEPTYMGCYATNSSNNNMTFIGGSPPPPEGSLQNGNFNQPQIAANSYQYISSNSQVPGWDFYAVLINNSTAWGYPMPYPSGPQAACIQATQIFGQWIQLNSGSYTLSFSACGRPGYSGANTINVYCGQNGAGGTSEPTIYTFTPPTTAWQNYSTSFNITTSGNYALGFYGTIDSGNNSTAIQNIQLTSTLSTTGGSYTYSQCQQAAINGGYQYFALQNVNTSTSTGYCAVSNDQPSITQYGLSTIPSQLNPVWSSNTSGQTGNSAILSVTGSLQVINSSGQAVFSTPNSNAQPSNYLGCYGDGPNRAMTGWVTGGSQQYDLAQCQQIAQQQGATYFGLQNSTSGTTAQCFLSDDLAQTIQYGTAGNCTQISDGSYSGGGYSNAVYNTSAPQSNYVLIVNDNSIIVQRGTNPNDNQGQIWLNSGFSQGDPNPQYVATNGIYGQNWITQGQTLAAGDWIGSPNGYAVLMMQSDGNLVLYTFSMQSNCQTMSDGNMGGGIGANATYNIGMNSIPGNIGNLAYIDANSEIHLYPTSNQTYSSNYSVYKNTDSPDNDISGAAFSGTQQQCQTACNENPNCAGYVTDASGSYCWPKTNTMFPYSQTGVYNSDRITYVRSMMPQSPPLGVSQNTNNIDTVTFQNYVNGGAISNQYGISQATSVQQQQLTQLQSQLNMLAQQIESLNGQYKNGVNILENQSQKNVIGIGNYLKKLINTNDNISSTVEMNNGNLQNILSDSDIVVLQKNYSYLVWSILAVGTVLVTMSITKK